MELQFFILLVKRSYSKPTSLETLSFKGPVNIRFQQLCENMPISTTYRDEAYYKAALEILCSFKIEENKDIKIAQVSRNEKRIRWLRSLCYSCLGDLTHNQRAASAYFISALIEKRHIRTK
jgi:hypothetical protein